MIDAAPIKLAQLSSISSLAALVAGFNVVALVELNVESSNLVLVTFQALFTALTVSLMTLSFLKTTYISLGILKASESAYAVDPTDSSTSQSFDAFWKLQCESDFRLAFRLFTVAVPCFLVNLALISAVKYDTLYAPIVAVSCVVFFTLYSFGVTHARWGRYLTQKE